MWRTEKERAESARRRLKLARELWGWVPHPRQRELFTSAAQVTVAACGRRWGKTECLGVDIATLALDELGRGRACRQLVVAPSEAQARLLGDEVLRRLRAAEDGGAGVKVVARVNRALAVTVTDDRHPGVEATVACRTAGRDGRGLRGLWAHRIVVDEAAVRPRLGPERRADADAAGQGRRLSAGVLARRQALGVLPAVRAGGVGALTPGPSPASGRGGKERSDDRRRPRALAPFARLRERGRG